MEEYKQIATPLGITVKKASRLYRWAPPNSFEKPLYMKWTATIVQPKLFSDIDIRKELACLHPVAAVGGADVVEREEVVLLVNGRRVDDDALWLSAQPLGPPRT